MENLKGRYLKALVDHPFGGSVLKGEYGLIKNNMLTNIDFPSQKNYTYSKALKEPDRVMLMPVGFHPDNPINILNTVEIY